MFSSFSFSFSSYDFSVVGRVTGERWDRRCTRNKIQRYGNVKYHYILPCCHEINKLKTYLWCISVFFDVIYLFFWLLCDPCHTPFMKLILLAEILASKRRAMRGNKKINNKEIKRNKIIIKIKIIKIIIIINIIIVW